MTEEGFGGDRIFKQGVDLRTMSKPIKNILGKGNSKIIKCHKCDGNGLDENMRTCRECDGAGSYVKN